MTLSPLPGTGMGLWAGPVNSEIAVVPTYGTHASTIKPAAPFNCSLQTLEYTLPLVGDTDAEFDETTLF